MSLGGPNPPIPVILTWPTPNYIDPVSQGPLLTNISIVSISLGVCIFSARIYSRFVLTKAPGLDDAMIAAGLIFAIAFSALQIVAAKDLGVGRHLWDVLPPNGSAIRLNLYVSQWCYTISMASIRISILLLYKRLSTAFTKKFFFASWIGIWFNVLYALAYCIMLLLECRPINAYWLSYDRTWAAEHTYHCSILEQTSLPTFAALSVLGDVYSTILPLTLVSSLQLPLRRKISLYILFALGFGVAGAGIVRTWYIYHTANKTYDTSWWMAPSLFWITFEMYLALLCACAPALKPFFKKFLIEPIKEYGTHTGTIHNQYHNDTFQSRSNQAEWTTVQGVENKEAVSSQTYELPKLADQQPRKENAHLPFNPAAAEKVDRRPSQSHSDGSGAPERTPASFVGA